MCLCGYKTVLFGVSSFLGGSISKNSDPMWRCGDPKVCAQKQINKK